MLQVGAVETAGDRLTVQQVGVVEAVGDRLTVFQHPDAPFLKISIPTHSTTDKTTRSKSVRSDQEFSAARFIISYLYSVYMYTDHR